MTPKEQFDSFYAELLEKGELTLKTIMHNGEEVSALKLMARKGTRLRFMIEEIVAINEGKISRHTRNISPKRAENYIWANLPPVQSGKEENPGA